MNGFHTTKFSVLYLTLSQTTKFLLLKLKEFADNNLKFDENSGKFIKRVENMVGKREIAHYKKFLRFPQCFQRTCDCKQLKDGLVWEIL